jgi:hypothetical protein
MTARRLQAVTRIRPGEGRTASALLTMMVVGMTGAAVGANGVESLFFFRFGPGFLPYLYLVLGPLTFAVMMGMRTVASGVGLGFLVRLPLAVGTTLLVARAILGLQLHWVLSRHVAGDHGPVDHAGAGFLGARRSGQRHPAGKAAVPALRRGRHRGMSARRHLDRSPNRGYRLVVPYGQVRALHLLLPLRSQGVQPGPEQGPHLLGGHYIAGG